MKQILIWTMVIGGLCAQSRSLPADTTVITNHKTTIKGKRIEYQATTGTQPVWNEAGNPIAAVHYTYYERTDVKGQNTRPIMISFNGGPGSGSVWMHLAYTGPMILNVDNEGYPVQPYGVKSNHYSILDAVSYTHLPLPTNREV